MTAAGNARSWYLVFYAEGGELISLLGPIKGGQEQAERLRDAMIDRDQQLADAVDWGSEATCAPYWYSSIGAAEYSPEEITFLNEGAPSRG